jgi:hypothetical protein
VAPGPDYDAGNPKDGMWRRTDVPYGQARLRDKTGAITIDDGYGNTGSCKSAITFIDGDKGILRYRGYPDRGSRAGVVHRGRLPADLRPPAEPSRSS